MVASTMRRARDREPLLTSGAVAKILKITPNGVRYLEHCGKLPARFTNLGQRIFRRSDVERLARARGVRDELEPPDAA